jgi:hypothetical protein
MMGYLVRSKSAPSYPRSPRSQAAARFVERRPGFFGGGRGHKFDDAPLAGARGFKQNIPQPRGIAALKAEGVAE